MTDINTIKNLLYFFPYLKQETWYMLGIGIAIYVIYISYLIAFERYYRSGHPASTLPIQESSIHTALENLELDDTEFFERLSLIIRTHLEDTHQVVLATKKTPRDMRAESIPWELKDILEVCTYHEYTGERAEREKKSDILERLKSAV